MALSSCGADPGEPPRADAGRDGGGVDGEAPVSCAAERYYVGRMAGQVLDLAGNPVRDALVTACGTACITGTSGADGRFDFVVDHCFGVDPTFPRGPIFWLHGLGLRPDLLFAYNTEDRHHLATVTLPAPLYAPGLEGAASVSAPARGTAVTELADGHGFTLRVPPGLIGYPPTADDREALSVVPIPANRWPPFVDPGAPPVALYALSPSETTFATAAALAFPTVAGLAPGAEVEVLALGNAASEGQPPAGVFARVDTGVVSADGTRVVARTGLRWLSWVGYRGVGGR
ncbi:MAG: hypothetical protein HY909_30670 [Deltaproteobacteria bacterium]|nr:hypothetical protein [Deltaproteobacteria bacterium]